MMITHQQKVDDPLYPIMQGETPLAKEFNRRSKEIWENGTVKDINFEHITTLLLEIFGDEFNKRHAPRGERKAKKK
jgi:hypothetical protein